MLPSASALHGVRVVELASLAGAYCGKLLADMGADVITVDRARADPCPETDPSFRYYGANKRSVVVDLATEPGRAALDRLIGSADVLLDPAPPWCLDHDAMCTAHPHLIVAAITPFGRSVPHRDYKGSDLVCQAVGGMVYVNGEPDAAPLQGAGLQAYHAASMHAAIGVMLALVARQRDGRGQQIEVSIQECVAACVEQASSRFFEDGTVARRQGTLHWTRHFRQTRCKDGFALLSTLGDWTALIEWVKADGKAADLGGPEWEDVSYRRDHAEHLFDVLDRWAAEYSVAELVDRAQLLRLPFAAVMPVESLPSNPQLQARGFFVTAAPAGDESQPGAPYVFSRTPWRLRRPAPSLGEHTQEVLEALPLPEPPISDLKSELPGPRPGVGALDGIRVIDFTWVVAGPVATRILADHGAEVIKIERLDATDFGSRRVGLTGNLNRGKRSIAINLNDERGLALARRLIAGADVVIDNFSPRVMPGWGLDYDGVRQLRDDIIAVNMSGFGDSGPWRDHVSYGPSLQALAGFSWLMRHDGRAPTGWGFSYSDMAAGCMAALATLFALWHRRRSGEGQRVDLSQFESLVSLLGPQLLRVSSPTPGLQTPAASTAIDNRSQEMPSAPHGVYACAERPESIASDRWCAIAVFSDAEWRHFCSALGDPAWARDPRFQTRSDRLRHGEELDARVQAWTRERRAEDVVTHLQRHGIAAAVVADARDLCVIDPHLRSRGYFAAVATPEGAIVHVDGLPIRLSETPGKITSPAPLLGEHTDAVLIESLGMTANEIAVLREARVVD